MRRAAVLLLSACVLQPLDFSGKPCSDACPDGYGCEGRICVPAGKHFCDVAPAGALSCLDFESGIDGGWVDEGLPGSVYRVENGALVSDTSDAGTLGRLKLYLPPWQHVTLSFDFKPETLNATDGFVALSEIQCEPDYDGAWFHYLSEQTGGPVFVLRAGSAGEPTTTLLPQPQFNAWTRVTLEAMRGDPNQGKVSLNGQLAGTTSFPTCPTSPIWLVNLGLSLQTGTRMQRAQFDNVVLQVE
jgi:hypothetical protein